MLFTVFADNVSLEIHLAQRMSNLTTVENWVGCPTTPLTKLLVASASYSEPKIFHFLVLVRNCETWAKRPSSSLRNWVAKDPSVLCFNILLIGRQVTTGNADAPICSLLIAEF